MEASNSDLNRRMLQTIISGIHRFLDLPCRILVFVWPNKLVLEVLRC